MAWAETCGASEIGLKEKGNRPTEVITMAIFWVANATA